VTYNQNVFYKTSSGQNIQPNQAECEKLRLENVRFISLLIACIKAARFRMDRKKALGNLMSALQITVVNLTSYKWVGQNIPSDNSVLVEAKQLLQDYFEIGKDKKTLTVRSPRMKKTPDWERKARAAGVPVSSPKPKAKNTSQHSKSSKNKAVNAPTSTKRVASVAQEFRKK
jgi:hypothetical protein